MGFTKKVLEGPDLEGVFRVCGMFRRGTGAGYSGRAYLCVQVCACGHVDVCIGTTASRSSIRTPFITNISKRTLRTSVSDFPVPTKTRLNRYKPHNMSSGVSPRLGGLDLDGEGGSPWDDAPSSSTRPITPPAPEPNPYQNSGTSISTS